MSKKSEDNVERFFRKALSQYDTAFREGDWKAMEKLLDERAIERAAIVKTRQKQISIAVATLALIAVSVYFIGVDQSGEISSQVHEKNSEKPLAKQGQAAAGAEAPGIEGENKSPSADLLPSSRADSESKSVSDESKPAALPEVSIGVSGNTNASEKNALTKSAPEAGLKASVPKTNHLGEVSGTGEALAQRTANAISENKAPNPGEEKQFARSDGDDLSYIPGKKAEEKAVAGLSGSNISASIENALQSEKDARSPVLPADNEKKEEISEQAEQAKAEEPVTSGTGDEEKRFNPVPTRWSFSIAVAPDFSSTGLGRYTAPGKAFGFTGSYQIHKRVIVSAGLIRSTKKYEGYGEDYQPPSGYWQRRTNGVIPEEITGRCEMLEIPLIIQYSVMLRERSRVFVSGGISSYVMMSESYRYRFGEPNPGAAQGWSTEESSFYPLKVGHFSAGYERQLSQRIAFGIEPFLKVPFAGMGWSNIDIYSTGVFFNLRYRIFKKEAAVDQDDLLNH